MPTPEEVDAFALLKGTPVVTIERTHLAGDRPIETADIVLRSDRFVIHTEQLLMTPSR